MAFLPIESLNIRKKINKALQSHKTALAWKLLMLFLISEETKFEVDTIYIIFSYLYNFVASKLELFIYC